MRSELVDMTPLESLSPDALAQLGFASDVPRALPQPDSNIPATYDLVALRKMARLWTMHNLIKQPQPCAMSSPESILVLINDFYGHDRTRIFGLYSLTADMNRAAKRSHVSADQHCKLQTGSYGSRKAR